MNLTFVKWRTLVLLHFSTPRYYHYWPSQHHLPIRDQRMAREEKVSKHSYLGEVKALPAQSVKFLETWFMLDSVCIQFPFGKSYARSSFLLTSERHSRACKWDRIKLHENLTRYSARWKQDIPLAERMKKVNGGTITSRKRSFFSPDYCRVTCLIDFFLYRFLKNNF